MQPPSQDPTNQNNQPRQPPTSSQPDWTRSHPGEEGYYGTVPPSSANYPSSGEKLRQPKRRNPLTIVVLVLVVLVIILGATTFLAWQRTSSSSVIPIPTATQQASASRDTTNLTATAPANSVATSTPVLSSVATPQPVATIPSGTITENLLLTCGPNCNDPIRVTITTIQVNDASGNMTWNISLQNVSGKSSGYGIRKFELLASGTQNPIPANFAQINGSLANSDPVTIQAIFAFVPTKDTTYTLTASIQENPFGGPTINFEPAQITNL